MSLTHLMGLPCDQRAQWCLPARVASVEVRTACHQHARRRCRNPERRRCEGPSRLTGWWRRCRFPASRRRLTASSTRLSGSTMPPSRIARPRRSVPRFSSCAGGTMPMPAAAMSGVAPSFMRMRVSAPPAASARMMSASRNFAASRYGVAPINVFGSSKSSTVASNRRAFGDRRVRVRTVREERFHEGEVASQDRRVQRRVPDGVGVRVGALVEQRSRRRVCDRCARRR